MKKRLITFISMLIASVMLASVCLIAGCGGGHKHADTNGDGFCDECGDPYEEEEEPIEPEEGMITVTMYWNGNINDSDLWIWTNSGSVGSEKPWTWTKCAYGGYYRVNVPEIDGELGFIIRTGVGTPGRLNADGTVPWDGIGKEGGGDRFIPFSDLYIENGRLDVYLKQGDTTLYKSDDGGKTLVPMKIMQLANMTKLNTVIVTFTPAKMLKEGEITLKDESGTAVQITDVDSQGTTSATLTLGSNLDITKQYTVEIAGYGSANVVPLSYFSNANFTTRYTYNGDDLGVTLTETNAVFKLWAPTTSKVTLNIYETGTKGEGTAKTYELERADRGIWTVTLPKKDALNKYYTYTVVNALGTNEVVDPYAVSAGVNGDRGMILDIANTNPDGYHDTQLFVPETAKNGGTFNYTDANLWEIHVRDFSNMNTAQKKEYRGKYMAFTETDLTLNGVPVGVNYLKKLGITHVHLMPSYDIASVDETRNDQFNWGYDPLNYNVPEGSYSTDPTDGAVRVKEFKAMVQALHDAGIGVIMDVVYNHTSGLQSNLQKIVPYYYYRFQANGAAWNGSGCGNETASERSMFGKFMRDSVRHWMEDYNIDGFRFDLMGLHDAATMRSIESTVHSINPNAIIYGEGWTGGGSGISGLPSTLANIQNVNSVTQTNGIAMFNDVIRDALKGGTNDVSKGYATGLSTPASKVDAIMFGVNGGVNNSAVGASNPNGWEAWNPTNVVNYASAHDNYALYDKLLLSYPGDSNLDLRVRYNKLVGAIVQTSLGIPFMQAGEEMLRSKPAGNGTYNHNSYNAPDEVNNLKWDLLTSTSKQYETMQYYAGLIAFRKAHVALRSATSEGIIGNFTQSDGVLSFTMTSGTDIVFVVYNPKNAAVNVTLPEGNWDLCINGTQSGTEAIESGLNGSKSIEGISCYVFVKKA